jgi:hypothetical protein
MGWIPQSREREGEGEREIAPRPDDAGLCFQDSPKHSRVGPRTLPASGL